MSLIGHLTILITTEISQQQIKMNFYRNLVIYRMIFKNFVDSLFSSNYWQKNDITMSLNCTLCLVLNGKY